MWQAERGSRPTRRHRDDPREDVGVVRPLTSLCALGSFVYTAIVPRVETICKPRTEGCGPPGGAIMRIAIGFALFCCSTVYMYKLEKTESNGVAYNARLSVIQVQDINKHAFVSTSD